jgi:tetratricopeptide (TPR) repeat protein
MREPIIPSAELDDDAWRSLKRAVGSFRAALGRGEQPAIDDYLPPAGTLRQAMLLELVHEEIEFCFKAGEPVRVDDYLTRYPDLAADPDSLGELREAESTLLARLAARAVALHPLPPPGQPRLGRFELHELVGKGSFGVVYKAWDSELARVVALKVARGCWSPSDLHGGRFLREARSAARLKHPHIVAVHDAGQIDGVCYLVAEFVNGTTLEAKLGQGPIDFRSAARTAALVAEALDYAHRQRIVHRDLKPANILIDQEENPIVADFGLARNELAGLSSSGDGRLIGTPAYMSPEQARGDGGRVDGRSDVFSLGVILYQMLTGRVPFGGIDRMVLLQLLHDDPRPPRSLNDRVPRDLETICLKAMAKEPHRRYATAGKLAEDLRLFLDGEPIRARRTCALKRELMRLRRRPVVAALGAAVIVITLAGFAGVTYQWQQAQTYRRRAETSLADATSQFAEAERQRRRVTANLEQANRTIHGLVSRLSEIQAKEASNPALARTMLMNQVLDDGWSLLRHLRGDPAFCSESARTSIRLASLTTQTYDSERIVRAWSQAVPYCQELARIEPEGGAAFEMLGRCDSAQAAWLERAGRSHDAKIHYRRAIWPWQSAQDFFQRRLRESPADFMLLSRLVGSARELAISRSKLGDARGAIELLEKAQRMLDANLRDRGWDSPALARSIAIVRLISELRRDLGQTGLALAQARRATRLAEELVANDPSTNDGQRELANSENWLAYLLESEGRPEEALTYGQRAVEFWTAKVRDDPSDLDDEWQLAGALWTQGKNNRRAGNVDRAVSCIRSALEICARLLGDHPSVWSIHDWRLQIVPELATAYEELGLGSAQDALIIGALEPGPSLPVAAATPPDSERLAFHEYNRGETLRALDRLAEAEAAYRSSLRHWDAAARNRSLTRDELALLGASRYRLSWVLDAQDRPEAALRSYWEAVAYLERCLRDFPGDPEFRVRLRTCLHQIGTIFNETGRPALALAPYRRALEIGESVPPHKGYPESALLMDCAGTSYRLGEALERLGRLDLAAAAYRNHIVRYRRVVAEAPDAIKPRAQLRDRLGDITRVLLRLGRWSDAIEAARERRLLSPQDPALALNTAARLAGALLPIHQGDSILTPFLDQHRRRCVVEAIAAVRDAARLACGRATPERDSQILRPTLVAAPHKTATGHP